MGTPKSFIMAGREDRFMVMKLDRREEKIEGHFLRKRRFRKGAMKAV